MNDELFYVILADDDEGDKLIFREALEELDKTIVFKTVDNGVELMEYLTQQNVHLPHLIFLDLNMPRKNGLQCLKEIRANEKLKDLCIAIYSTSDNEIDMEETFLNGANIYINKPNDFNVLKKLISKAISNTRLYERNPLNRENFFIKIE